MARVVRHILLSFDAGTEIGRPRSTREIVRVCTLGDGSRYCYRDIA
ncbi:MAG: hypothetical protein ACXWCY_31380 [Burkholderiales bacterium]